MCSFWFWKFCSKHVSKTPVTVVAFVRSGHFAHWLAAWGIMALAETSRMDVFIEARLWGLKVEMLNWISVTFVVLNRRCLFHSLGQIAGYTRKGEVMLGEEMLPVHHTATLTRSSSILAGKLEKECGVLSDWCVADTHQLLSFDWGSMFLV